MQEFIGTKIIQAEPQKDAEGEDGYKVVYEDGYTSWSPKDVFENFPTVKPAIQKLKKENNNAKLGELMVGFCTFMTTSMPPYQKEHLKYVEQFLLMMPIDTAAILFGLDL